MTASESRGVQVEAQTLSGQRIAGLDAEGDFDGLLVSVCQDQREGSINLRVQERRVPGLVTLAPTDLVTLTDRGAS